MVGDIISWCIMGNDRGQNAPFFQEGYSYAY